MREFLIERYPRIVHHDIGLTAGGKYLRPELSDGRVHFNRFGPDSARRNSVPRLPNQQPGT